MGNFAGNAIIAKAKTLFGYRLRAKDYEELSRFNSIPDVIGYLKKNNKFSNTLSNALEYSMHRGQLEDLIKKSYFENPNDINNSHNESMIYYFTGFNTLTNSNGYYVFANHIVTFSNRKPDAVPDRAGGPCIFT